MESVVSCSMRVWGVKCLVNVMGEIQKEQVLQGPKSVSKQRSSRNESEECQEEEEVCVCGVRARRKRKTVCVSRMSCLFVSP